MSKSITRRIDESFSHIDRDDTRVYLEWLNSSISDLLQNMRRTMALAALLVAVYILVEESPKTTFSLAGFQISKGSLVFEFIPVLCGISFSARNNIH